jgi:hypothetical protein
VAFVTGFARRSIVVLARRSCSAPAAGVLGVETLANIFGDFVTDRLERAKGRAAFEAA